MPRTLAAIAVVLCLVPVLTLAPARSARAQNLLENPALAPVPSQGPGGRGAPPGWALEGAAAVERTDDGFALTSTGAGPFLFQQISLDKRLQGSMATLSAWVRSAVPEGAYIEFSNRKGMDVRSKPHPGDGLWHRLELTVRIPATDEMAEFRLRNYRSGTTYIREAVFAPGSRPGLARSPVATVGGGPAALWFVPMALLALFVPLYFRRRRAMVHARLAEAGLLLLVISNIMLLLSRPEVSAVASNIAWILVAAGALVFALASTGGQAAGAVKRPGAVYGAVFLAVLVFLLYELATGSVKGAEGAAKVLYAVVVIEAAVMAVRRVRGFFAGARELEAGTVRLEAPGSSARKRGFIGRRLPAQAPSADAPPADFPPDGDPDASAAVDEKPITSGKAASERVPMG